MQGNQIKKEKKKVKERVAFKTRSEVEVLDDGFKWRKYGKKMVKNSPNPRYRTTFSQFLITLAFKFNIFHSLVTKNTERLISSHDSK